MHVTVLSPHRDDAAFSCGILLTRLLGIGIGVRIVNICTESGYAPYLQHQPAMRTQQVSAARQKEDDVFLRTLLQHANAERTACSISDLGWKDVPLRWHMTDEAAQASRDIPEIEVVTLEQALRAVPPSQLVFAPQAIGGHIDHRLVRAAAERAFPVEQLVFYEDLPYACRQPERETTHGAASAWLPASGAAANVKRIYAQCYPSQIAQQVADEMEAYAALHGFRERFVGHSTALAALQRVLHAAEISA